MRKPPKTEANLTGNVTVLSVSPIPDDHISLKQIIHYSELGVHSDSRWELNESLTLTSAVSVLRQQQIPVVICERDLQPGTWREMLEQVGCLPSPPLLIVTSRLADEQARRTAATTAMPRAHTAEMQQLYLI